MIPHVHMRCLRVCLYFLPFGSVWRFYSYVLICIAPLFSVCAPDTLKTDGRRRRLRGRGVLGPRVDIRNFASVGANEAHRSRLDPAFGLGLNDDGSTGPGHNARSDEDTKTRAVSAGLPHPIRGERQIVTFVESRGLPGRISTRHPPISTSFPASPCRLSFLVFRSIPHSTGILN